jgi:hypothetical protein
MKTAEASQYASQGGLLPPHVQALTSVVVIEKSKSVTKKQKVYFGERIISFSSGMLLPEIT